MQRKFIYQHIEHDFNKVWLEIQLTKVISSTLLKKQKSQESAQEMVFIKKQVWCHQKVMTAWQEFFFELLKSLGKKVYGIWFYSRPSVCLKSTTVSGAQRAVWVPLSSVYIGNNKRLWGSMTTSGGNGSWSFSHTTLALIRALSCTEVKVDGSKVKVKSGFVITTLIGFKSRTESRILTILAMDVDID